MAFDPNLIVWDEDSSGEPSNFDESQITFDKESWGDFAKKIGKEIVKSPVRTLLTRPAERFGEALAYGVGAGAKALGYEKTGEKIMMGAEQASKKESDVISQLTGGRVSIPSQGLNNGYEQVAGEGLESALYFTAPSKLANYIPGKGILKSGLRGAIGGATTGGIYGAAGGLQQGEDVSGVVGGGLKGAAIGGAVGGVLGLGVGTYQTGKDYLNKRNELQKQAEQVNLQNQQMTKDTNIQLKRLADENSIQSSEMQKMTKLKEQQLKQFTEANNIAATKDAAPYTVKNGKLIKEPTAVEAIKKGLPEEDVSYIVKSTDKEKDLYKEMYDLKKNVIENKTITKRPEIVPGTVVKEQVDFLHKIKKDVVGPAFNEAKKSLSVVPQDITEIKTEFARSLLDRNIGFNPDGTLNFTKSVYKGIPTAQKDVTLLWSKVVGGKMTPYDMVTTGQNIDKIFELSKSQNKLLGDIETLADRLGTTLKNAASKTSETFASANRDYAKVISSLKEFNKIVGSSYNPYSDKAQLRIGEVANRVLGNASARPLDVLDTIQDVAKEYGYRGDIDYKKLVLFNDLLEDTLGITQTRSLGGQVQRATEAAGAVKEIIKEPGLMGKASKAAGAAWDFLKGRGLEDKLKALEKLIGYGPKDYSPKTPPLVDFLKK